MPIGVRKMKNSIWIVLYLLLLFLIVFFEYQKSNNDLQTLSIHKYDIKDNKALDSLFLDYTEPLEENISINKLWKLLSPKPKKVREKVLKDINITKPIEVVLKEKTICIEKKCFRLLGLFFEKVYSSSFYVKEDKEKVQTFRIGEFLNSTIKIKNIKKNSILFKDVNSTREWSIKLFDVNSSKYKPKEFE